MIPPVFADKIEAYEQKAKAFAGIILPSRPNVFSSIEKNIGNKRHHPFIMIEISMIGSTNGIAGVIDESMRHSLLEKLENTGKDIIF